MNKPKTLVIAATMSVALMGGLASDAYAVAEVNVAPGKTLKGPGVAVHGYDPVAYFTEQRPVQGAAEFSVVHGGATYRFANAVNMKAFQANPDKYVPACAKFDGDPRFWKIVDGKLYLNLNGQIQKTWLKDIPGNIATANHKWRTIVSKSPEELS